MAQPAKRIIIRPMNLPTTRTINIDDIIESIPEIPDEIDSPDYIIVDRKPCEALGLEDHNYSRPWTLTSDSATCARTVLYNFCHICRTNCRDMNTLFQHFRKHTEGGELECKLCGVKCFTAYCLNNHYLATHKSLCEVCGLNVPEVQLEAHQMGKDDHDLEDKSFCHFCVLCLKYFLGGADFRRHLKQVHGESELCNQ